MAQGMVSSGSVLRPQAFVSKNLSCVTFAQQPAQLGQFSYKKILLWIQAPLFVATSLRDWRLSLAYRDLQSS